MTFPSSHYVCIAWHLEHLDYSMVIVVLDHHLCNVSALTTDTNGYPIQSHNTQGISGQDTVQRMHVFNLGLVVHMKSSSNTWPQIIPCLVYLHEPSWNESVFGLPLGPCTCNNFSIPMHVVAMYICFSLSKILCKVRNTFWNGYKELGH